MKILIVEDEVHLANSIKKALQQKGFDVEAVYDGETGAAYALSGIYDLLILDVMMPKMDGYEVIREVRAKHNNIPILMLTAKSSIDDKVLGLNSGADLYMTKPFDSRELLASINALLRRQGSQVNELSMGNTRLDLDTCILTTKEKSIRLSAKEFDIMRMLLSSKEKIIPKDVILSKVWGFDSNAAENHVEVYMGFLRKKLARISSNIKITAVRYIGYHLEVDDHASETEN